MAKYQFIEPMMNFSFYRNRKATDVPVAHDLYDVLISVFLQSIVQELVKDGRVGILSFIGFEPLQTGIDIFVQLY